MSEAHLALIGLLVTLLTAGVLVVLVLVYIANKIIMWVEPPFPHGKDLKCIVRFNKSGEDIVWNVSYRTILNLAHEHKIKINYDCERGECAKCAKKVSAGDVHYLVRPRRTLGRDFHYMCIVIPASDVTIEA